MILKHDISHLTDQIKNIYKDLHQIPELGFEEVQTSRYICEKLNEFGIEHRVVMLTGIIADIHGYAPGKTLAIRADIDALPVTEETGLPYASLTPGRMHACGHDAHTAMLLGAAKYLSEHRELFPGTVRLVFQPAEEGFSSAAMEKVLAIGGSEIGGAASMINAGAMDGVDMCLALHVQPSGKTGTLICRSGPAFAASDTFRLTITGEGGHGAQPQKAIDPMLAAAEIILAFSALPSREFSAIENSVVSVCTVSCDSSSENTLPGKVFLSGTVRSFDQEIRHQILHRLEEISFCICAANRCKSDISFSGGCAAAINSTMAANLMMSVAEDLLGVEYVKVMQPEMGSEDVGEFFNIVPGAMAFFGITKDGNDASYLHSPNFQVDLDALEIGALLHINNAIRFLNF